MTTNTYQVYKLLRYGASSGSHAINRGETWEFKKVGEFATKDTAKQFIKDQTENVPAFKRLVNLDDTPEQYLAFLEEFCFGDKYVHQNDYFIGKPVERLSAGLARDGIKVVSG